jgi:PAS domain-containing protein
LTESGKCATFEVVSRRRDEDTNAVVASMLVQSTLLGELLENAHIGALAVDEGRCVAANAYLCDLLGYDREDLIGTRTLADVVKHGAQGDVTIPGKDGADHDLSYRVVETTLAGMDLLIGLFWLRDL